MYNIILLLLFKKVASLPIFYDCTKKYWKEKIPKCHYLISKIHSTLVVTVGRGRRLCVL